jgi:endoglucanase
VGFRFVAVAVLLSLAVPAAARDRAADVKTAFARAQHLKRGINASEWFAQSRDYSAARIDRYTDRQDIELMAKLGFDHVRLSVDPVPLEQSSLGADGLNVEFIGQLDRAVDAMLANGLAVEIDLQPADGYKQQLQNDLSQVDRLTILWRKLAGHYSSRDSERVFFEIMNEPWGIDPQRWPAIEARVAAVIRQVAPLHTIIASGANNSDIPDLLALEPLADGNVIYNFHFYEPHEFTHQGGNWGLPWWKYTHSIPYPPTESSMQEALKEVPDAVDRYQLENYFLDGWDAHHIRLLMDEATTWAHEKNVPLICNEFGAYREYSDPTSRATWIRDTRTALEADSIGWAMWDYRGGFGVVTKENGKPAQVDDLVVKALGLTSR